MKLEAIKPGMILNNRLSNGAIIEVRVMHFVENVGMYRVTDSRETACDEALIAHDRTWAVPHDNLSPLENVDFGLTHKSSLTFFLTRRGLW